MFGTEVILLEELKHSNTRKCHSGIFRFDNYCLQLIIMHYFMQLLVPKVSIMWEMSVSKAPFTCTHLLT